MLAISCSNPTGSTFSTGSFNGVTPSLLYGSGATSEDDVYLIAAVVPSGSGTQTISFTFSDSLFNLSIGAYVIRGAEPTPVSGGALIDDSFPFAPTIALDVPLGGAVFSVGAMNSGTTANLSVGSVSLTRTIAANSAGTRSVHYGATTDAPATVGNWSQSSSLCFAAGAVVFAAASEEADPVEFSGGTETAAAVVSGSIGDGVVFSGAVTSEAEAAGVLSTKVQLSGGVSQEAIVGGVLYFDPGLVRNSVVQYYYLNSLVSHETGDWSSSTQLPNWMERLSEEAGKEYNVDSEFGFLDNWTLPPRANMGYPEAPSTTLVGNSWTNASTIDRVSFVPDNFDGQTVDPDEIGNIATQSYQDGLLALIDGWETNATNAERVYSVYAGWPDMGPYGDPATISPANLLAWQTWALGGYQEWFELLVSRLQNARPSLDIRLSDVNRILMLTYQNTVVSTISAGDLFEDDAPHGRSSWYFLASLVEYMETYGEKPPSTYVPLSGHEVNSVITSNYEDIVDYMWSQWTVVPIEPVEFEGGVEFPVEVTGSVPNRVAFGGSVLSAAASVAGVVSFSIALAGGAVAPSAAVSGGLGTGGAQYTGGSESAAPVATGAASVRVLLDGGTQTGVAQVEGDLSSSEWTASGESSFGASVSGFLSVRVLNSGSVSFPPSVFGDLGADNTIFGASSFPAQVEGVMVTPRTFQGAVSQSNAVEGFTSVDVLFGGEVQFTPVVQGSVSPGESVEFYGSVEVSAEISGSLFTQVALSGGAEAPAAYTSGAVAARTSMAGGASAGPGEVSGQTSVDVLFSGVASALPQIDGELGAGGGGFYGSVTTSFEVDGHISVEVRFGGGVEVTAQITGFLSNTDEFNLAPAERVLKVYAMQRTVDAGGVERRLTLYRRNRTVT